MKATEILKWIIGESINGEFLNLVDVPEEGNEEWEQNEEWWDKWCGSCPPHPIPSGREVCGSMQGHGTSAKNGFGKTNK